MPALCNSCGESDLPVVACRLCGAPICDPCTLEDRAGQPCCQVCRRFDERTVALLLAGATVGHTPLPRVCSEGDPHA